MKRNSNDNPKIWFPAKRFGWGWGLPCRWQGWAVMGVFVFLVIVGAFALIAPVHPLAYLAYVLVLCAGLHWVLLKRGEPPRWRWGDE